MKRKLLLLTFLLGLFSLSGYSQSDEVLFSVSASADSIYFGNKFKITFTLENGQGDNFLQPEFRDFKMASGQMTTSKMSVINGEMSQSSSYSFYLEPKEIGRYFIEPASIEVDGEIFETEPYEIFIMANPDGIIQEIEEDRRSNSFFHDFDMTFPPAPNYGTPERKEMEKKKKKRKTTRL
ncbi:MAG: hypothetical protein DWQ02_09445 [Bacteroidetes bacterium]|nr:MAG: hypothetical protein DWQ02_09445 [Bacteroidota bacterium]